MDKLRKLALRAALALTCALSLTFAAVSPVQADTGCASNCTTVSAPDWQPTIAVRGTGIHAPGTITPAYGRTLLIQKRTGTTWVTQQTIVTGDVRTATVTLVVPAMDLWDGTSAASTTNWRLLVPEIPGGAEFISPTTTVTYTHVAAFATVLDVPTWAPTIEVTRSGLTVAGTIAPAYGRTLVIQKRTGGHWFAYRTVTTGATGTSPVTLSLPKAALNEGNRFGLTATFWRVHAPATTAALAYTSPETRVVYTGESTEPVQHTPDADRAPTSSRTRVTVPGWTRTIKVRGTGIHASGTITPAFGRAVRVQRRDHGRWKTIQTRTTAKARTASVKVRIKKSQLRAGKAKKTVTRWRVVAPATEAGTRYVSPVTKIVFRAV